MVYQYRVIDAQYATFHRKLTEKFPCEQTIEGLERPEECNCWNCLIHEETKKLMNQYIWVDERLLEDMGAFRNSIDELFARADVYERKELIRRASDKLKNLENLIQNAEK